VVGTLRIDGIVGGVHGMIAIVSNPQQRVYFLREGDKLYDGSVQHITIEAVSFKRIGKDAFGKPLERQVTKRIYPTSPGELQMKMKWPAIGFRLPVAGWVLRLNGIPRELRRWLRR